jgi:hypothetical protein
MSGCSSATSASRLRTARPTKKRSGAGPGPGERQLHLRLHTRSTGHTAARRLLDQVVQQRRLAHARLAAHHQRPALTRANSFDQPVEHVPFAAPALEPCRASSDGERWGHLPDTDVTRVRTGGSSEPRTSAAEQALRDRLGSLVGSVAATAVVSSSPTSPLHGSSSPARRLAQAAVRHRAAPRPPHRTTPHLGAPEAAPTCAAEPGGRTTTCASEGAVSAGGWLGRRGHCLSCKIHA